MLKYIWISLILLLTGGWWSAFAADQDSTRLRSNGWFKGVILDVDVVEPAISLFSSNHTGLNASLAFDFKHRFYPVITVGYASYDATDDYSSYVPEADGYQYKVDGPYFKVGLDFNIVRSSDPDKKFFPFGFLGVRYAFSPYNFTLDNSTVMDGFSQNVYSYSASGSTFAQWGEFVGGIRVPVFKRLHLGMEGCYRWAFSVKTKHYQSDDGSTVLSISQSYAPGYGDDNDPAWGFRYFISFYF